MGATSFANVAVVWASPGRARSIAAPAMKMGLLSCINRRPCTGVASRPVARVGAAAPRPAPYNRPVHLTVRPAALKTVGENRARRARVVPGQDLEHVLARLGERRRGGRLSIFERQPGG